ncbi:hypothetical protein Poli38472_009083 [Pythium oligandrum]|uniref:Serine hydrolase domain-containing protein n=1 Tax=Pythium oligandrum TaxID=41045 RepID=A0A8K1CLJ4_PYTOL|nr:hypothetical protein Poli38472_009083 [Pythium oligandrum]|eukprot:TMW64916.1 hypothetical protein Poli38472_009083 [Pythium oligandrum]
MTKKLRILCLHGHRTNAKVMENQAKGLRAAMGETAEFIFLNAPNLAPGPGDESIARHHAQDAPFYEWWNVEPVEGKTFSDEWSLIHTNGEKAFEFMDKTLRAIGPIDVVMGFSQGAVLLTLLSMKYMQLQNEKWWKLCICVGGVSVRLADHREFFTTPDGRPIRVPFPSIHIIGEQDPFRDEGELLANQYDDFPTLYAASPLRKMILYHSGGHKFPSPRSNASMYQDLTRVIHEHCRLVDDDASTRSRL